MAICRRTLIHNTVFIYRLLLNIHNVCGCINIYSVFDPFKSGNVFVLYGVHILVVKVMLCNIGRHSQTALTISLILYYKNGTIFNTNMLP